MKEIKPWEIYSLWSTISFGKIVYFSKLNCIAIKLRNRKSYYKSVLQTSLLILLGFILVQLFNTSFLIGSILLCLLIEIIFLSEKFTQSVCINDLNTTIVYYIFFQNKISKKQK